MVHHCVLQHWLYHQTQTPNFGAKNKKHWARNRKYTKKFPSPVPSGTDQMTGSRGSTVTWHSRSSRKLFRLLTNCTSDSRPTNACTAVIGGVERCSLTKGQTTPKLSLIPLPPQKSNHRDTHTPTKPSHNSKDMMSITCLECTPHPMDSSSYTYLEDPKST